MKLYICTYNSPSPQVIIIYIASSHLLFLSQAINNTGCIALPSMVTNDACSWLLSIYRECWAGSGVFANSRIFVHTRAYVQVFVHAHRLVSIPRTSWQWRKYCCHLHPCHWAEFSRATRLHLVWGPDDWHSAVSLAKCYGCFIAS